MTLSLSVNGPSAADPISGIREVQPSELPAWDRFVAGAADGTCCHLSGWREIMSGVLGHECRYLVATDVGGAWRGVLPLVRVRGLAGHFLISLPFLNDGGPLGDQAARDALAAQAVSDAERRGAGLVELRVRRPLAGSEKLAVSNRKITVHLALPETVDELWERTFKAKLRSQIRRPTKDGMTIRIGSAEVGAFYAVFARNMRDLGTPVLPRQFFERLPGLLGDHVQFAAVYSAAGVPVAAACCLLWQKELEMTWASSLREYNSSSPNMLLYASLMEHAIGRRLGRFNFGRCTPGGATHKFKQQWGGHDVPLPWATWSRTSDVARPSADSRAFHMASTVWKRMPMALANRLGPILARQLP